MVLLLFTATYFVGKCDMCLERAIGLKSKRSPQPFLGLFSFVSLSFLSPGPSKPNGSLSSMPSSSSLFFFYSSSLSEGLVNDTCLIYEGMDVKLNCFLSMLITDLLLTSLPDLSGWKVDI